MRTIELGAALPGLVLLAITATVLAAAPLGLGPLWPVVPLTLSEAAALHDDAEILKLLGEGADVNAPSAVRADILTHGTIMLTPLEAVIGARQTQTLRLLLDNGARVDETNWSRLTCFALRVEADELVDVLKQRMPGRPLPDCSGVTLPYEID